MNNKYKYLTVISTIIYSFLMIVGWFTICAVGTVETHSFMTIPSMLNEGAGFLTQIGGKLVAITILILGATLKYMCIVSASLGLWGSIRTILYSKKSRLIYISQIISLTLCTIAVIAILFVNVISRSMLGGVLLVTPTIWLVAELAALILSFVGSNKLCVDKMFNT